LIGMDNPRGARTMPHQTCQTFFARTVAAAAFALLALGTPAAAQGANEIMRSLSGDPAARANEIIEMEIPMPGGQKRTMVLDYSRSIDLAVFFPFDSAEITPQAQWTLNELGQALAHRQLAGQRFLIAGHTDAAGSDAYNRTLSERRALAVAGYLQQHFGIRPARLVPVGFGESRLADPARPRDGVNRRVEVTLIAY